MHTRIYLIIKYTMASNKLIIYSFFKSVPNPESYAIIRIIIRNITRGNVSVAGVKKL